MCSPPRVPLRYPAERGESFYNPQLRGVVEELEGMGVAVESEGAKCVFIEVRAGRGRAG
jgi:arginyl-tRNA synthetase